VAKNSKKRYNLSGGLPLHDARRVLGVPIIAHTGRVNSFARCMGSQLKSATSVSDARNIMETRAQACNPRYTRKWTRKDGRKMSRNTGISSRPTPEMVATRAAFGF
jgi:hypothetical protein